MRKKNALLGMAIAIGIPFGFLVPCSQALPFDKSFRLAANQQGKAKFFDEKSEAGKHRALSAALLEAKNAQGALREINTAIRLDGNMLGLHSWKANVLGDVSIGDRPGKVRELYEELRLIGNNPSDELRGWAGIIHNAAAATIAAHIQRKSARDFVAEGSDPMQGFREDVRLSEPFTWSTAVKHSYKAVDFAPEKAWYRVALASNLYRNKKYKECAAQITWFVRANGHKQDEIDNIITCAVLSANMINLDRTNSAQHRENAATCYKIADDILNSLGDAAIKEGYRMEALANVEEIVFLRKNFVYDPVWFQL